MAEENRSLTDIVVQWPDGSYRWEYRLDMRRNMSMLKAALYPVIGVFLGITVIAGVLQMIPIWFSLLMMAGFIVIFLLGYGMAVLLRRGEKRIPYYMDDTQITVNIGDPKKLPARPPSMGRIVSQCGFAGVSRVREKREADMIELIVGTPFQVYVRQQDYDFVLSYILDHIPEKARERSDGRL